MSPTITLDIGRFLLSIWKVKRIWQTPWSFVYGFPFTKTTTCLSFQEQPPPPFSDNSWLFMIILYFYLICTTFQILEFVLSFQLWSWFLRPIWPILYFLLEINDIKFTVGLRISLLRDNFTCLSFLPYILIVFTMCFTRYSWGVERNILSVQTVYLFLVSQLCR